MISNINVQILRIGLRLRNSEGRIKAVRKQWTSEKEEEQRMVSSIITCLNPTESEAFIKTRGRNSVYKGAF